MDAYEAVQDLYSLLSSQRRGIQFESNVADRVSLSYSITEQDYAPRMLYRIDDEGALVKTGLQYEVSQPWWETPDPDDDDWSTSEAESSRAYIDDTYLDITRDKLSEDDRLLMEEFDMSEEEFAEYISDVDSFGTTNSNRTSIVSVDCEFGY